MSIYGFDDGLNKTETPTKAEHDAVAQYTEDSGWIYPTLASPFSNDSSNTVRYRKIGKIVFIEGAVITTSNIAAGGTAQTIFTLPEGYRPSHSQYLVGKGVERYTYYLRIYTSGRVTASNYGISTDVQIPNNTWLSVNAAFAVD